MSEVEDLLKKERLRPDEAARVLDVSPRTVRRWMDEGILSGMKVRGVTRVDADSVRKVRDGGD